MIACKSSVHTIGVTDKNKFQDILEKSVLALGAVISFALFGLVFYFSDRGLDLTDESFYLLWIIDPRAYTVHIPASLFGFVYHPLFRLVEGDVSMLRKFNLTITLALAGLLSFQVLNRFWRTELSHFLPLVIVAIATAATALLSFDTWLLTPNYNTLAFQAILISFLGMLSIDKKGPLGSLSGLVIGLGGWLAIMAKPTSALGLGLAVLIYVVIAVPNKWRQLLTAILVTVGLLLLSAWHIDGSLAGFARRWLDSIQWLTILGSGQSFSEIFRRDSIGLSVRHVSAIFLMASAIMLGGILLASESRYGTIVLIIAIAVLLVVAFMTATGHPFFPLNNANLFYFIIASVATMIVVLGKQACNYYNAGAVMLGLIFLATPHIYAFGTNGNYWIKGSQVGYFWIIGGLVLLHPLRDKARSIRAILPLSCLCLLATTNALNAAINEPYRQQQSLRESVFDIPIGKQGHQLKLPRANFLYVRDARKLATAGGFKAGSPIIDLSGQSPGLIMLIGGKPLGQPWMVGAYPGSDALAIGTLRTEDCSRLARAFILVEPTGPRSLNERKVLGSIGADMDGDYETIAIFEAPDGNNGFAKQREQLLMRPTRPLSQAAYACIELRS